MPDINPRDEALVRKIVESVYQQLGDEADRNKVKHVVAESLKEITEEFPVEDPPADTAADPVIPMNSNRVIITAFGKNKPGVVAMVTDCLADNGCDILDISQKILQEFFALILITDMSASSMSLRELKDCLGAIGNKLGIRVLAQHEDVFNFQHRI